MQTGKGAVIRLMVVDDSSEQAEAIVNTFRNAGISVRPVRPASLDELAAMIGATPPPDLVVASRNAASIPLATLLERTTASGKDLPVVVLSDGITDAQLAGDIASGARGVALRSHPEHLLAISLAEWENLNNRRALRRLGSQLRETERRCDSLIDSSRDPIAYIHEGMHIRANAAYLEMFGYDSFEDVEGMSLLDMVAPTYVNELRGVLKQLSKGETPPPFPLEARTAEGDTFPATLEFTPASFNGEQCAQIIFQQRLDVMDSRELEALRERDPVTGLLNRPSFLHRLEDAVAEAGKGETRYGLLLLEPDHYARLLPEIGLKGADAMIAAIAARLLERIGPEAQAGRLHENCLAVLLPGDFARTEALAETLRSAYDGHVFSTGSLSTSISVSIGGLQISEKNANLAQSLARAGENLKAAMALGGNRTSLFDPDAVDRAQQERMQSWIQLIHDSIRSDGFTFHYLPIVSLTGQPGELYECLLRLESGKEVINPATFMGIAEQQQLLGDIDRWAATRAIRLIAERLRGGHDTRLVLKVSAESIADARLVEVIARELAANNVPGDRLLLQIPETKVSTNLLQARQFFAEATRLGCLAGLERFGSGLDPLQLLNHFTPAFVKIDRALVEDLPRQAENQQKIRAITARAKADGIITMAEFVQDGQTMTQLVFAGVDYAQGYFLAQPGPDMDFEFG